MATTLSAHAVAAQASKVAGRTVTDKQVRGVARDIIGRFDKTKHPAYQSHAYTAAEARTIVATFARRASGSTRTAAKSRTVARKTARTAKVAAQTPAGDA